MIKSAKLRGMRGARWQETTKQAVWRSRVIRPTAFADPPIERIKTRYVVSDFVFCTSSQAAPLDTVRQKTYLFVTMLYSQPMLSRFPDRP